MLNVQRIAWPLIVVLALSAGAVWHVATAQEKTRPGAVTNGVLAVQPKALPDVQKSEYKIYGLQGFGSVEREKILNSFGMEGWELVAVVQQGNDVVAYLKRRKSRAPVLRQKCQLPQNPRLFRGYEAKPPLLAQSGGVE